jgi:hypothetical protein
MDFYRLLCEDEQKMLQISKTQKYGAPRLYPLVTLYKYQFPRKVKKNQQDIDGNQSRVQKMDNHI